MIPPKISQEGVNNNDGDTEQSYAKYNPQGLLLNTKILKQKISPIPSEARSNCRSIVCDTQKR